jgi:quercetin dioxygenase-like cupin family protein
MKKSCFVRGADVPAYHPANHLGTSNYRLISEDTVGARGVEMLLGVIEKNGGALPHAHPGIEQVCYLLEGAATATVNGETCDMLPGDACYFPPDTMHIFTVTSDTPARVLVVYTPPYGERPENVVRAVAGTSA